jgi:ketosteroid isomerase-like protein
VLADDDDRVVGIHRATAERAGKRLQDDPTCLVFQLKDGRVTEAWEYHGGLYAWDEFWS